MPVNHDLITKYRVLLAVPNYIYVRASSLKEAHKVAKAEIERYPHPVNLPITIVGIEKISDGSVIEVLQGSKFKIIK